MKTRIIHTEFWKNMAKHKAPKDARLLYNYLITNMYINMSGLYELPDAYMMLETGLNDEELQSAKTWLTDKSKAFFYEDWVKIPDAENYNNYKNGKKTKDSYKKEIVETPKSVLDWFNKKNHTSIEVLSASADSNPNKETINHKSETRKEKPETRKYGIAYLQKLPVEDLVVFNKTYQASRDDIQTLATKLELWCITEGKTKKNYRAFLQNRLLDRFGYRKLEQAQIQEAPEEISEEQRLKNRQRIAEMKAGVLKNMGSKMTDEQQSKRQNELIEQAKQI